MLNPLSDVATAGETIVAVWVQTAGTVWTGLSAVLGNVGPPTDTATAVTNVENGIANANGLQPTEVPTAYVGGSTLYIGCSMMVTAAGDGQKYDALLKPISDLGGLFTAGAGPILAFVDYGDTGESSAPLAQQAAAKDDTGYGTGLTPTPSITGMEDAIDALGAETPYFQTAFKGVASAATTLNNQAIGPTAATAQAAGQAVVAASTAATGGIVLILVALIAFELLLSGQARKALA